MKDDERDDRPIGSGLTRREFFGHLGKAGGAILLGGAARGALAGYMEHGEMTYWDSGIFHHDAVDSSEEASGIVRALLEGSWRDYTTIELPSEFLDWNIEARLDMLRNLSSLVSGEGGAPPSLAGPHNAAMATCGGGRRDSVMKINNAFKGMGLCPHRDRISELMDHMTSTASAPMPEKLQFLVDLYSDRSSFDLTKLVSLELYSTTDFETHTFLNLMAHPETSLVFLDSKSYEIRGIGELIHPGDQTASRYLRDVVSYTNIAHSYFHGEFPRLFPGIVVHVCEVFDNSPGTGRGVRLAPAGTG
ncbi:hypothetical protein JW921_02495 [Candidatus Fermentibacterales bacterium]|nr:hypothetical protein [Candidatus Fermentibacterales bacterium]